MAGNHAVRVGSVMFLAAVTGLLSPPSPPHPPSTPPRRGRATALPRHRISATLNFPGGSFDADAWREVAAKGAGGVSSQPAPEPSPGGATVDQRSQEAVDYLDVEKLPTFAFFAGDGGRLREDVVGESNARSCGVTLQNKLGSLWGTGGEPLSQRSPARPPPAGKRNVVGGGGSGGGGVGGGISEAGNRDTADFGGVAVDSNVGDNIIEVASRDELRRIVSARREEQGPVVVMYHASWCRKCAYLTPVFRRLARGATHELVGGGHDDGGGDSDSNSASSDGPVFCRVDVSTWGRRVASVAADGGRGAAEGGGGAGGSAVTDAEIGQARTLENGGVGGVGGSGEEALVSSGDGVTTTTELLHEGSPAMENCGVCGSSGFVACGECEGRGAVARSSPDGKHTLAVTCPACVGYKRLRCPSCGGKCYMCE